MQDIQKQIKIGSRRKSVRKAAANWDPAWESGIHLDIQWPPLHPLHTFYKISFRLQS